MIVADVMTEASVVDTPDETLRAAAARMWQQQTGSLLIMDGDRLVGILTERDLLRAVARGADLDSTPASEAMTTGVRTVESGTSLHETARMMAANWIRHLPVVDSDKVVGVVSQRDLVGILAALGPAASGSALPSDQLVRDRRLARIEQGDLD
ncbi:MAG: CBS domain-containing protein [Micromonosporaceae bacterium]